MSRSLPNPFSPVATGLYVVAWALVMLQGWGARIGSDPTTWLNSPVETAQRVVTRDLELAEANAGSGLLQPIRSALFGSLEEVLEVSIAIQRNATESVAARVEFEGEPPERLVQANTSLSVLLAESGDLEAASSLAEQSLPPELERAIRTIYAPGAGDLTLHGSDSRVLESLAEAGLSDWLLERPAIRLLESTGNHDAASEIASGIEQRGARWQRRSESLAVVNFLLLVAGAGFLAAMALGAARSPARVAIPWSASLGFAVLVRADFWGRLYFVGLGELGQWLPNPAWLDSFYTWGTLISSLPLLWLIHRHLAASSPRTFFRTFGLAPTQLRARTVLTIAAAALAIDLLGATALAWATWAVGSVGSWSEGVDELLIFGSTREVIESCVDYLLLTPVFEELMFRGLLFYTLRSRFSSWEAAAMSAILFSAIHFYSLPGFLITCWSGFVWAIAFERARSLWPAILAHSTYNLFFVLGVVSVYR